MLRFRTMVRDAQVVYRVPLSRRGWELSEEKMPESVLHDEAVELLKALLAFWAKRHGNPLVARNLAIRWDEDEPRIGLDPDVCVVTPAPPTPTDGNLRSVRTWVPGHAPPSLAIEVVSDTNPRKDYIIAPDKYAASGVRELWIFDPLLAGPTSHGGPFRLQVWERDDDPNEVTGGERGFVRTYEGEGPAFSRVLSAHLVLVDDGRKLRIADDPAGKMLWLTAEEAERVAKDAERAARDSERAEAFARIAELEAELARRPK